MGTVHRSGTIDPTMDSNALDSLQFNEEIQHLMTGPPENANSFTALLELPAPQAMELLHHPSESASGAAAAAASAAAATVPPHYHFSQGANLTFPSDIALIERAARFSVFADNNNNSNTNNNSPETSAPSNSSGNIGKVKCEPAESDSNYDNTNPSQPNQNQNQKTLKRKEREKKVKLKSKLGFVNLLFPSQWHYRKLIY